MTCDGQPQNPTLPPTECLTRKYGKETMDTVLPDDFCGIDCLFEVPDLNIFSRDPYDCTVLEQVTPVHGLMADDGGTTYGTWYMQWAQPVLLQHTDSCALPCKRDQQQQSWRNVVRGEVLH